MSTILSVDNVSAHFKKIAALDGVSFNLVKGTITGLIGQNGAGKSTLLNCINGIIKPSHGDIKFQGESLLNKAPHKLMKLGIARTFQQATLFDHMTILENMLMGLHSKTMSGFSSSALKLPFMRREEKESIHQAKTLLAEFNLDKWQHKQAKNLPIYLQKRIELLRALINQPKLLLLDEPASGLTHADKQSLKSWLSELRQKYQITILMVEHNIDIVMQMSDKVIVLDFGRKIAEGTPAEVQHNEAVIHAYIGEEKT